MLNRKVKKIKKGFTLVELVFVTLIVSIFMLSVIKITMDSTKVFKRGVAQSEMKEQLRRALDAIATDVRQALIIQGSTEWISPPPGDDKVLPVSSLKFKRYIYSLEDEGKPKEGLVEYDFVPDPDRGQNMYILTRKETVESTIRYNIIAEKLYVDLSNLANGSHFKWEDDKLNAGKVVNNALAVRLVSGRYAVKYEDNSSGKRFETFNLETSIALKSIETNNENAPIHPTQYSVFMDSPSSLIDPRD